MHKRSPFILLVVAPNIVEAHNVVVANGIPLPNQTIRHARNAYSLLHWPHGCPILFGSRDHWPATEMGRRLSEAVEERVASGKLRLATDEDIQKSIQEAL